MAGLGDAFTNALDALQGNFSTNIVNGTNPLSQPQATSLFGFNIPGVPLISTRDFFLLQMQSWLTTIPLQSQWIALIESYPVGLNTGIIQGLERIDGAKKAYDISIAKTLLTTYPLQKIIGCLFAQGAVVPGETVSIQDVAIENNRGFVPGVVSRNRAGYAANPLSLTFTETNTSFLDLVLRPWIMLVSHYGLVARKGDANGKKDPKNIKTTLRLFYYTRSYQNVSQIPRKVFTFHNCFPYQITQQTLTYDEPGVVPSNVVNWGYSNYTIENSMYLPLADIINNVSGIVNGNYTPFVSPLQDSVNLPTNAAAFF